MIKNPIYSKAIKKSLYELTGRNYRLAIFKAKNEDKTEKRDPLEDLISKAQGNIKLEIN
jgi:hypothetical protein